MADRYPDQGRDYEGRGRNYGRSGRWSDTQGGRNRQSGQSRFSRSDEDDDDYTRRLDQDREDRRGMGAYGGAYGQGMSGRYGGGYSERQGSGRYSEQDWDDESGGWTRENFQGQGAYAQGGQGSMQGAYGSMGQSYGQGRGYRDEDSMRGQSQGYGYGDQSSGAYGGQWGSAGRQGQGQDQRFGGMAQSGYDQGFGGGQSQQGYLSRGGRQQWGRHAGRGPKNYVRSDDRIRDDINDRLTDDPHVDASEIDVKVANCEVTLSGTVDSREAKRRAEDCVEAISGVKHVQNNLRVQASTGAASGEDETTRTGKRGGKGGGDAEKMQ